MTDLVLHLFDGYVPADPPAAAPADEGEEEVADTSGSSRRPKCRTCKGPNYSPEGNVCIACRILLLPPRP